MVTLRLRGRIVTGWAEVHDDRLTVVREVQRFLADKGVQAARMINVSLNAQRPPTEAEIMERTRGHVVVVITLHQP